MLLVVAEQKPEEKFGPVLLPALVDVSPVLIVQRKVLHYYTHFLVTTKHMFRNVWCHLLIDVDFLFEDFEHKELLLSRLELLVQLFGMVLEVHLLVVVQQSALHIIDLRHRIQHFIRKVYH